MFCMGFYALHTPCTAHTTTAHQTLYTPYTLHCISQTTHCTQHTANSKKITGYFKCVCREKRGIPNCYCGANSRLMVIGAEQYTITKLKSKKYNVKVKMEMKNGKNGTIEK